MKDRLNLPSVLVLNSCGITCAGDEKEIAAFCAHVSELDLSDNKLEDWQEKEHVLGPSLGFANLFSTTAKLPGRPSTQSCRSYQIWRSSSCALMTMKQCLVLLFAVILLSYST